ncbi:MAG: hypothetical protein JSU08_07745 [Acidobacteria bacterium]|nr:hypothetical protein [Acidobacteriota bacterium]
MTTDRPVSHRGAAVLGLVLFVAMAAAALAIDVPRTTYGLKSDEATYIMAALSAAYDGDLQYERKDLERFAGIYHSGPDGIFLKRGKVMRIRGTSAFPFVRILKREDPNRNRLYFGKAMAYSVMVAPFVRFFGVNGILLFHAVLIALSGVCAYLFLAAQRTPSSAAALTTAFLGASILPVYGVFLMPEIFNFTLVLTAYFLWLYKEVRSDSVLARPWTTLAAAVILGLGTYSKPLPTAVLVAPIVLLAWWRRRWVHGFVAGFVAVVVACALFGLNAVVTGEFNYQGGDRKTFYASFPFDAPDGTGTWERRGGMVTTDTSTPQEVLRSEDAPFRFAHNVEYFLIGRHFGFVPYFFPGVVAIVAWALSREARVQAWRLLAFGAVVAAALGLLILLPWTWSGGGGPPGNRYFFTAYPVLLFLIPPGVSLTPGVLAWVGGALFTAKMLINPFVAAKFPFLPMEKGPARRLPVELTMANDLPVRLAQPLRGHVQYRTDPGVLLYHLDQNSWPPEPNGMWISGSGRSEIIMRTAFPVQYVQFEAESPVPTVITISLGSTPVRVALQPKKVAYFNVPASGVRGFGDYNYLLVTHSTEGFVPHLLEPGNMDYRNLGAQLRFRPVTPTEASGGTTLPK